MYDTIPYYMKKGGDITDGYFLARLKDLSKRNGYAFTDFLDLEEQSVLENNKHILGSYTLFGGCDGTERNVARFGDSEELGYEEDFPIVCLEVVPKSEKFAEPLCHRDFLGALMNLGIERKNIGDISASGVGSLMHKNNRAYIFVLEKISDYILSELTKVKHTLVECRITENLPSGGLYELKEEKICVPSLRCDCFIAEVFRLSRSESAKLFDAQKVFVNGRCILSPGTQLKQGDTVSVRGFGRFRFLLEQGKTKKGNTFVNIGRFI